MTRLAVNAGDAVVHFCLAGNAGRNTLQTSTARSRGGGESVSALWSGLTSIGTSQVLARRTRSAVVNSAFTLCTVRRTLGAHPWVCVYIGVAAGTRRNAAVVMQNLAVARNAVRRGAQTCLAVAGARHTLAVRTGGGGVARVTISFTAVVHQHYAVWALCAQIRQ